MSQALLAQVAYRTFQAQHRPLQTQAPQNVSPQSTQTDIKNGMATRRFLGWKYAAKAGKNYQALFNRPRAGIARPRMKTQVTGAMAAQVNSPSRRQLGAQTFPGLAFRDSLPSGFIPTGVATGDFNGDGNTDWVVSNAGDNDLWVYLGNGDGTASIPTILNLVGLGPVAVATGDLRGDGKIDIVVAEADSGTIEIFLGNGDGTFASGGVYSLNGMPTFVVLADFNRDGKLDVAVSQIGQSPIAFLAGNGDGTLSAPVYDTWGGGYPQIGTLTAIDVNNDGKLDLVYFDSNSGAGLALGHGDGTFSTGMIVAGDPDFQYFAATAGDVDEDGCADIVLVDGFALAEVYKGNCDGTFSRVPNYFGTGDIDVSVALRDVDGDGHLDIVAGGEFFGDVYGDDAGNLLSVLKGDGHGGFAPDRVFRGDPGMYSLAFLNLTGSSLPSIVAASQDADEVTVFKNDGTADFGPPRGRSIGYTGGTANSPYGYFLIADLNQDHLPDLLTVEVPQYDPGIYQITAVLNQGNGKFSAAIRSPLYPSSYYVPGDFAVGDFRNTGRQDVIAVGMSSPFLAFAASDGDGSFASPVVTTPPAAAGLIGVGDFNRDGKLDFVVMGGTGNGQQRQALTVFLGNGNGTFTAQPTILWGGPDDRWPVSVYVSDFNGDGKLDVLVYLYLNQVPYTRNDIYVFYGKGDGTFQQPVKLYSTSDPFTLVDVNHDGIPDIVTCRFPLADYPGRLTPASTSVMLGTGRGGFGPPTTYQTYPGYSLLPTVNGTEWGGQGYCTVGDFNGDGNIDIGVMQFNGFWPIHAYLQFLSGNGDGTFTPTYNIYPFKKANVPQEFFDLTGDGKTDLIEMDAMTSSFNVIPGTTAQAFQFENVTAPITGTIGSAQLSLDVLSTSDTMFTLQASDPGLQAPPTVTIPAGAISQQFTYTVTNQADVHKVFKITASLGSEQESMYNFVLTDPRVNSGFRFSLYFQSQVTHAGLPTSDYQPSYGVLQNYETTLQFSCSGLPVGATCDFTPPSVSLAPNQYGFASMVIQTTMDTAPGTYDFQAIASDSDSSIYFPATVVIYPPAGYYALNVSVDGTGSVTSTDGFINCPGTCSHSYLPGIQVTLEATPAQGGVFGGWSGACIGTDSCTVTMTQPLVVGAVFSQAEQFVPLSQPCRAVDTRPPSGNGPIPGGTFQNFPISGEGGCASLPSAAVYSMNVTVVPSTGTLGYLTIWPAGQPQPVVSTMNSVDGRVKANAAFVPAGNNGAVSIYVTDTTNVIVDVNGYFAPPTGSTLAFYPLPPCRVADTRNSNFPPGLGPPSLAAGQERQFPILNATSCDIPSSAAAYSLNFTVVPSGSLGYLTVWPTGQNRPTVSTLNDLLGRVIANAAIVVAGTGSKVSAYATNNTDLVIDINGYFAPAGPGGLSLYSTAPCRVIDTRHFGSGEPFIGVLNPPVTVVDSQCGVSSLAQAYIFNATVIPPGSLGYLTLWPDGTDRPTVSTLNASDGSITNNMAIVPTNNGKVDAYASGLTQLILDISSYFAP
jgi:hypothetical protein